MYDRLVSEALLKEARADAELIFVGKVAGESHDQEAINRLLIEKAHEVKRVVRLKGGDPFVFGRGGEEAEALRAAGIAFEVVPGVTSAVAVPAYAGIPVTHRGLASTFAVITGHEDPEKPESSIDWAKLATAVDTLVFLMGDEDAAGDRREAGRERSGFGDAGSGHPLGHDAGTENSGGDAGGYRWREWKRPGLRRRRSRSSAKSCGCGRRCRGSRTGRCSGSEC